LKNQYWKLAGEVGLEPIQVSCGLPPLDVELQGKLLSKYTKKNSTWIAINKSEATDKAV